MNVTLERQTSVSLNTRKAFTYTSVVNQTRVTLGVFDSDVHVHGFLARVQLIIRSQEDFGEYQLVVTNNIKPAASRIIEIVPEGIVSYTAFTIIVIMLDITFLYI